jgi:GntR family transcriptional regulator
LAARYGTARNTAREAISLLQSEGLVIAQHGRGVFVRPRRPLMRLGADRYTRRLREETGMSPFRAEVAKQGRTASVQVRSVTVGPPPADVAERLNLDPATDRVVRRENWYYADDEPVQFGVTHVPVDVAGDSVIATEHSMGQGGIYLRFEEIGYLITRIREEVSARMPSAEETAGLALPPGVPVLVVLHTSIDANGRPFEVTRFVIRADLSGLVYEMPVDN